MRRATVRLHLRWLHDWLFQSTLSVRRATLDQTINDFLKEFQSTLSVRRATTSPRSTISGISISIHALREESDSPCTDHALRGVISIHALREESDASASFHVSLADISIHALREESDPSRSAK